MRMMTRMMKRTIKRMVKRMILRMMKRINLGMMAWTNLALAAQKAPLSILAHGGYASKENIATPFLVQTSSQKR